MIYRRFFIRLFCVVVFLLFVDISYSRNTGRFTVVIDAGHGGKDSGTCHNGGREKDINLKVALLLGQYINSNYPEVRVLYTRKTDVFVGLQQRADYANRHNANLFISVHVNSAPSGSVSGTETYVLGLGKQDNNLSVAMRENKAMLLEGDYKTVYKGFDPTSAESYIMFQVMQNAYFNKSIDFATLIQREYRRTNRYSRGVRQDILWVLSQSAMPAVLTELGFLTNRDEARYLLSGNGQKELATAIGRAFGKYYTNIDVDTREKEHDRDSIADMSISLNEDNTAYEEQESMGGIDRSGSVLQSRKANRRDVQRGKSESRDVYTIKFMSVKERYGVNDRKFSNLKGKVTRNKYGRYYIYSVGSYNSYNEAKRALQRVRRYYKDAEIKKINR